MEQNIDQKKNDKFLEILQSEQNLDSNNYQSILFITTDSWLAQLGSRRDN